MAAPEVPNTSRRAIRNPPRTGKTRTPPNLRPQLHMTHEPVGALQ